jgi:hypothetical protein
MEEWKMNKNVKIMIKINKLKSKNESANFESKNELTIFESKNELAIF